MANNTTDKGLKGFLSRISPPNIWKLPVFLVLGVGFGLLIHVLYISNAYSYMSDNPETCINCHVMTPQYATWERGSHGRVASCNDCHVPQGNIFEKYFFKASDGLRHATMFTFRLEPQVIRIKEAGEKAVQENCVRCHENHLHPVSLRALSGKAIEQETTYCWHCHREVPHGKVHSLTSTPYARTPRLSPVLPEWMAKIFN